MINYGEYVRSRISNSQHTAVSEGYPCNPTNSLGRHLFDYKIYGNSSQPGTPSISSPADFISVGDLITDNADENYGKYQIPVVAYSRNLIKCDLPADEYSYGTAVNRDFSITVNAGTNSTSSEINIMSSNQVTIPKDNVTLTASCKNASSEISMIVLLKEAHSGKTTYLTIASNSLTFTLSKGDCFQAYLQIPANGTVSKETTLYPQVEVGDSATGYEPYVKPITTNIYLNEPLRKIGDYADFIDFKNRKAVRKINEEIVGTKANTWKNYTNSFVYEKGFPQSINSEILNTDTTDKTLVKWASLQYKTVEIKKSLYGFTSETTVEECAAYFTERIESGQPLKVQYVLANPVEEKISLPVIPIPKGNVFVATSSSLSATNIELKYAIKP